MIYINTGIVLINRTCCNILSKVRPKQNYALPGSLI